MIGFAAGGSAKYPAQVRRRPPQRGAARQVRRGDGDGEGGQGEDPPRRRRRVRQGPGRVRDGGRAARTALRKDLQARRDRENRHALEDAVVEALLASHEFQVPECPRAAPGRPSDRAHPRAAAAPGRGPRPAALGLPEAPRGAQAGRGEGGQAARCSSRPSPRRKAWPRATSRWRPRWSGSPRPASGRPRRSRMMEQSGDLDSLRYSLREAADDGLPDRAGPGHRLRYTT